MKISLILNGSTILKAKIVQTAEFRECFTKELTEFVLKWFRQSGKALPPLCDSKHWWYWKLPVHCKNTVKILTYGS